MKTGRPANDVYARELEEARAVSPFTGRDKWRFHLTFGDTDGIYPVRGRKTRVVLEISELTEILKQVPASLLRDRDDLKALLRVIEVLEKQELFFFFRLTTVTGDRIGGKENLSAGGRSFNFL